MSGDSGTGRQQLSWRQLTLQRALAAVRRGETQSLVPSSGDMGAPARSLAESAGSLNLTEPVHTSPPEPTGLTHTHTHIHTLAEINGKPKSIRPKVGVHPLSDRTHNFLL